MIDTHSDLLDYYVSYLFIFRKLREKNAYFESSLEKTFTIFFARVTQTQTVRVGTYPWTRMAEYPLRKFLTVMSRDFILSLKHSRIKKRMKLRKKFLLTR